MLVVKNIPFLRRLFEILQLMAQDKTLPAKQRVNAIGIMLESAFYEYKNCDAILNIAYSELIGIIEDEKEVLNLRVEAILLMLLLFKNYKLLLPKDKAIIKDDVNDLYFGKIRSFLKDDSNTEGWLVTIEFLIQCQEIFPHDLTCEKIFKEFNQKLLSIAHDENQKIENRILSISLLFESMYKYCLQKYSSNESNKIHMKNSYCDPQFHTSIIGCFDVLHEMANDRTLDSLSRVEAIEVILTFFSFEKNVFEKTFDKCFEILVEFINNGVDSEVLLGASILLFNGYESGENFEKIGKKCIRKLLKIISDQNEKHAIRIKAINFIMHKFKGDSYGFTYQESLDKVSKALADMVLSGEFFSEGYIESVRLYFNVIYNHEKKPASVKQVGRNDLCLCGSGKKYKKCCHKNKNELDFYRSIKDYNQVIKFDPNCASAFYDRGFAKYLLGQYQEAIKDYDRAIALKPDYPQAFNNRALSKRKLGLHQAAVDDFDQAITLDPNNSSFFANRGAARYDLDQYQMAIDDFDQATALDPNDVEVFQSRRVAEFMNQSQTTIKILIQHQQLDNL